MSFLEQLLFAAVCSYRAQGLKLSGAKVVFGVVHREIKPMHLLPKHERGHRLTLVSTDGRTPRTPAKNKGQSGDVARLGVTVESL